MREVFLEYAEDKIKKSVERLEKEDSDFYRHIRNAFLNIQEDVNCGIKIPKKLIPKEWIKKYEINNLYWYQLPNAWRFLYSLVGSKVKVIAIILGCYNHKNYERLFNY